MKMTLVSIATAIVLLASVSACTPSIRDTKLTGQNTVSLSTRVANASDISAADRTAFKNAVSRLADPNATPETVNALKREFLDQTVGDVATKERADETEARLRGMEADNRKRADEAYKQSLRNGLHFSFDSAHVQGDQASITLNVANGLNDAITGLTAIVCLAVPNDPSATEDVKFGSTAKFVSRNNLSLGSTLGVGQTAQVSTDAESLSAYEEGAILSDPVKAHGLNLRVMLTSVTLRASSEPIDLRPTVTPQ